MTKEGTILSFERVYLSFTGKNGSLWFLDALGNHRSHVRPGPGLSITEDVQTDGLLDLDGLWIDILSCYVFASRQTSQCQLPTNDNGRLLTT